MERICKVTLLLLLAQASALAQYTVGSRAFSFAAASGTRCSNSQLFTGQSSSYTVNLPCATAGDLVVIFMGSWNYVNTPANWSYLGGNIINPFSYWAGGVFYKVLNSSDVSAGNAQFALYGTGNGIAQLIEFVGSAYHFDSTDLAFNTSTGSQPSSVTGPALPKAPAANDTLLTFGSYNGNAAVSINTGTVVVTGVQTTNGGSATTTSQFYASGTSIFSPVATYPSWVSYGWWQGVVLVHAGP